MVNWYFKDYFIENKTLFIIGTTIIVLIIILTIFLVCKEVKKNANK